VATGQTIINILRFATSVKSVELHGINSTLSQQYVDALCGLQEINVCHVNGGQDRMSWGHCEHWHLDVVDIQRCLVHWPQLRRLTVHWFEFSHKDEGEYVNFSDDG
jgi:hypothetical protein